MEVSAHIREKNACNNVRNTHQPVQYRHFYRSLIALPSGNVVRVNRLLSQNPPQCYEFVSLVPVVGILFAAMNAEKKRFSLFGLRLRIEDSDSGSFGVSSILFF